MNTDPAVDDPYARSNYRRLIAWESRIERERPFLAGLLDRAPDRSVLDIGCGTGEHAAFFADLGARTVGLDRSEKMIETAKSHESRGDASRRDELRGDSEGGDSRGTLRFVLGDAMHARRVLGSEPSFGLCICLGNMLPHILEDADLKQLFEEVRDCLVPGGLFLSQILNYRRLLDQDVRHLPLNFREGEESEEIVFLRLLKPQEHGRMLFFPTTLTLDPSSEEEPVAIKATRRVELRAWTVEDLVPRLEGAGFRVQLCGDMRGGAFVPPESSDLVLVATK